MSNPKLIVAQNKSAMIFLFYKVKFSKMSFADLGSMYLNFSAQIETSPTFFYSIKNMRTTYGIRVRRWGFFLELTTLPLQGTFTETRNERLPGCLVP